MRKAWISLAAALAVLAIAPAADASTASKIRALQKAVKQLQHDNKVLSGRIATTTASLNGLRACMQYVKLTQYGAADGTFGYLFNVNVLDPTNALDPANTFATTAVDGTGGTDPFSAFLILAPACSPAAAPAGAPAAAAGRVFGGAIPAGTIATATRPATAG